MSDGGETPKQPGIGDTAPTANALILPEAPDGSGRISINRFFTEAPANATRSILLQTPSGVVVIRPDAEGHVDVLYSKEINILTEIPQEEDLTSLGTLRTDAPDDAEEANLVNDSGIWNVHMATLSLAVRKVPSLNKGQLEVQAARFMEVHPGQEPTFVNKGWAAETQTTGTNTSESSSAAVPKDLQALLLQIDALPINPATGKKQLTRDQRDMLIVYGRLDANLYTYEPTSARSDGPLQLELDTEGRFDIHAFFQGDIRAGDYRTITVLTPQGVLTIESVMKPGERLPDVLVGILPQFAPRTVILGQLDLEQTRQWLHPAGNWQLAIQDLGQTQSYAAIRAGDVFPVTASRFSQQRPDEDMVPRVQTTIIPPETDLMEFRIGFSHSLHDIYQPPQA